MTMKTNVCLQALSQLFAVPHQDPTLALHESPLLLHQTGNGNEVILQQNVEKNKHAVRRMRAYGNSVLKFTLIAWCNCCKITFAMKAPALGSTDDTKPPLLQLLCKFTQAHYSDFGLSCNYDKNARKSCIWTGFIYYFWR